MLPDKTPSITVCNNISIRKNSPTKEVARKKKKGTKRRETERERT
jgi:hypothetical protein